MKNLGYCLAAIGLFVAFKLVVVAAGLATGYYLFHVRSPRPHITERYIDPLPDGGYVITRGFEPLPEAPLPAASAESSAETPPNEQLH